MTEEQSPFKNKAPVDAGAFWGLLEMEMFWIAVWVHVKGKFTFCHSPHIIPKKCNKRPSKCQDCQRGEDRDVKRDETKHFAQREGSLSELRRLRQVKRHLAACINLNPCMRVDRDSQSSHVARLLLLSVFVLVERRSITIQRILVPGFQADIGLRKIHDRQLKGRHR